jgi:hypothetical protein
MTVGDHAEHCRHVSLRAVLQLWQDRHGCQLKRRKRRPVSKSSHIDSFIETLADTYDISHIDWDYGAELRSIYAESEHLFGLIEVLTGLQFLLQSVIEMVVLEDRRVYLQQQEGISCSVWEIFDEKLSPRNKMLLAFKS